MKNILFIIVVLFTITFLVGCLKKYNCDNVKREMTKLEVIDICGEPDQVYTYIFKNEEVWEYSISGSFYHRAGNKLIRFNKDGKVISFIE